MAGPTTNRNFTIMGDQPMVMMPDGRPSLWILQFLQWVRTYIGSPGDPQPGVPPGEQNLTAQIAALRSQMAGMEGSPFAAPFPALTPVVYLSNGARLLDGQGDPANLVAGYPGDVLLRRDASADAAIYVKDAGVNTSTGWRGVFEHGVLPLVNGDLPGPALMSDPLGQTIGVPI